MSRNARSRRFKRRHLFGPKWERQTVEYHDRALKKAWHVPSTADVSGAMDMMLRRLVDAPEHP